MSNIKYLMDINKRILSDKSWILSISSYIIKRVFLMFFTIFMFGLGYNSEDVALYYLILFFTSFAFVYIFNFIKSKELILMGLLLFALSLTTIFIFNEKISYLMLAIVLLFMFSEVFNVRGLSSIVSNLSTKMSHDIITISSLYTVIFPAIAFSLVGVLADINENIYIYFIYGMQFLILFLFLISHKNMGKENTETFNVVKLSNSIHKHTLIAFLYSSIAFTGRFLLMPMIIIEITKSLGFTDSVFGIFGIIVSIMCISNLIYNSLFKMKTLDYKKLMLNNVLALSIIWISLSILYIVIANYNLSNQIIIALSIVALPLVISIDFFAKLWSIGMVNSLKTLSIEMSVDYKKSLFLLNIYKNLGFSFGFFAIFLLSSFIDFSYVILTIGLINVIYCLKLKSYSKNS
jgi:hypothetical protein